jgi:hypothetical protein
MCECRVVCHCLAAPVVHAWVWACEYLSSNRAHFDHTVRHMPVGHQVTQRTQILSCKLHCTVVLCKMLY